MKIQKNRTKIILISLAFILLFRFIPAPADLSASGMQVIGIFIGILILWMTTAIDWPSLLAIGALAFVPEMNITQLLASSIGSSTFAFLMFTFMCTYALGQTSFIRRIALAFLNTSMAKKGGWSFITAYFLAILCLGSIISPTVLVVVMIALSEEIFSLLKLEKGSQIANMMMMGMVFTSGIAAGMTPIAHVFPLMAMSFYNKTTGLNISYLDYILTGIPMALMTLCLMMIIFKLILKPNFKELKSFDISSLKQTIPPFSKEEKLIVSIFMMIIGLWIIPDLIKPILPSLASKISSYGTAMPPLLGALAMFMITVNGKPLLDFKEATSKGIPWASLIMVAGTLSLASALTNENIGLTTFLTNHITPLTNTLSPIMLVFLFITWASIQTNLSSNMVTVTLLCSIALPITVGMSSINSAALASMIGMMAAYAFATPPAMATIVFAIGSGWTNAKDIAKYGSLLMAAGILAAMLIGYPLASFLM